MQGRLLQCLQHRRLSSSWPRELCAASAAFWHSASVTLPPVFAVVVAVAAAAAAAAGGICIYNVCVQGGYMYIYILVCKHKGESACARVYISL